jgi:hypothetical protein
MEPSELYAGSWVEGINGLPTSFPRMLDRQCGFQVLCRDHLVVDVDPACLVHGSQIISQGKVEGITLACKSPHRIAHPFLGQRHTYQQYLRAGRASAASQTPQKTNWRSL